MRILNGVLAILLLSSQVALADSPKSTSKTKPLNNKPVTTKEKENLDLTENIHGFLQLGTDHVWRGISFSRHSPEVFGAMLYSFPLGIYGGLISYNTSLSGAGIGLSPIVGVRGERNSFSYDISARYEDYPRYNTAVTPDIFELYGEIGYALSSFFKIAGGLGYSPDYYFKSGTGLYTNGLIYITLPKEFILNAGLGYQSTQKGAEITNLWFKDYLNWSAGVSKNFKNDIKIGFQYTQTNLSNLQCNDLNVCGPAYNLYARKTF